MTILVDLIVIGQGAPNQLKDGRQCRCVCAYSVNEKQFYRIYPVPVSWFRKWDIFDVYVEKNEQDHRENTWKIKNSKEDWKRLDKWIKIKNPLPKEERENLIKNIQLNSLSELIENKKSFGLIKPKILDFKIEQKNLHTEKQLTLVGNYEENLDEPYTIINQSDYKYKPYLTYECEADCKCKNKIHKQSISEWGCYEFMRKNPGKENQLKENLRLFDPEYNIYLLLGNIHKAPQTYIIIDIFRFKKKNETN